MRARGVNVRFRKNRTFPAGRDYDRNAAISDMIVQRKNDDRKVVALSVVPLSIAFIEAILVRTQFFGVFSGTPNIA